MAKDPPIEDDRVRLCTAIMLGELVPRQIENMTYYTLELPKNKRHLIKIGSFIDEHGVLHIFNGRYAGRGGAKSMEVDDE